MSNYIYNVPPQYTDPRVSTPNPQAGQYNYSQASSGPAQTQFGAITPGTATGIDPNTGSKLYEHQRLLFLDDMIC